MQVKFKTLIPNIVKNFIIERTIGDPLNEAVDRLSRAFNQTPEFKNSGSVLNVEYDEHKQMIGTCTIKLEVNGEKEAKEQFSKLFSFVVKKGQKFKFISFDEI